jgi:hypothetical protein
VYHACDSYVIAVVGSPGNSEIATKPDSSRTAPSKLLAKFSEDFGFAHLTVNATALAVQWERVKSWDAAARAWVASPDAFWDTFYVTK